MLLPPAPTSKSCQPSNNGDLADRIRALQTHASRLAQATDDKTRN